MSKNNYRFKDGRDFSIFDDWEEEVRICEIQKSIPQQLPLHILIM
jgi:hypothetical protein